MKSSVITLVLLFAMVSFVLARSNIAPIEIREEGDCPGPNEVFNPCGGCFVKVCGVSEPKGIACAAVCRPRCECQTGFIRASAGGPCIPEYKCKSTEPNCGSNEEYNSCGSRCVPTCDDRKPGPCTEECVAGCFCKLNYIRERINGSCICEDECKPKC